MKSIYFKQTKPLIASILGIVILVLLIFLIIENNTEWSQISIMCLIGFVLWGYSVSYEIKDNLNHNMHFKLFGFSLFRQRLEIVFPDYIIVFSALFKKDSDWGPVAALGSQSKGGTYVIRFFKGNKHFTLWKTNNLELANNRAKEVGELLDVEVRSKS